MDLFLLLGEIPVWADELVQLLVLLLGGLLTVALAYAGKKLGGKWGAETASLGEMTGRSFARQAIRFAEKWAKNQDSKPDGPSKLAVALEALIEFEERAKVGETLRKKLEKRLEAELEGTIFISATVQEGNIDANS